MAGSTSDGPTEPSQFQLVLGDLPTESAAGHTPGLGGRLPGGQEEKEDQGEATAGGGGPAQTCLHHPGAGEETSEVQRDIRTPECELC